MSRRRGKQISQNISVTRGGRWKPIFLYGAILGIYIFSIINHRTVTMNDRKEKPQSLRYMAKFKDFFFTGWNFGLQILFLLIAITDEVLKLAKLPKAQTLSEKARNYLFSTFVFPCSLIVITIFWSIWHIDRELIFPKILDDFYPSWLNHTLHTLIGLPLLIEILFQRGNDNYRIAVKYSVPALIIYMVIYQSIYLSVYFRHGVWLYPVYKVLTWSQRIVFMLFNGIIGLVYHQLGILLITRKSFVSRKSKLY